MPARKGVTPRTPEGHFERDASDRGRRTHRRKPGPEHAPAGGEIDTAANPWRGNTTKRGSPREGSSAGQGIDAQAHVHPRGGRRARRRGTDSDVGAAPRPAMNRPRQQSWHDGRTRGRRRCRVAVRTGRSNPSRHGRSSGSAADKAGCTTAPWTLRRSGDGRRPGEAVAVGSIVRWSSAPAQAADDERRTRSGISARREGGVGDGTADCRGRLRAVCLRE
jgi:hypothetical protein